MREAQALQSSNVFIWDKNMHITFLSCAFSFILFIQFLKVTTMRGKKYGKYEVEKIIGEGSFGKVYLASGDNEKVALKCIPKKTRTLNEIRNLKSETQLLTKVKHDNIICMKDCFETADQLIVVMEYAGDDLSHLLEKEKKLPEDKVKLYAKQILSAMLYLHQNRITHRDLKPQNILLREGVIKICDFGFAKKMTASTNFLRSIKGTPLYIAPQILQQKPYTHKVDVWSLGIILYQLSYGKTPFYASTIQQLKPKILHETVKYPKTMSPILMELIDGMLQKTDAKRFDWNKVKNHPFFAQQSPLVKMDTVPLIIEQKIQPKQEKIVWNAEEECGYILKLDSQFTSGNIQIKELKYNEDFCLRVTQLLGQACVDRSRISTEVLSKALKIIVKLAMNKPEGKEATEVDITKNRSLMTAVITLAFDEQSEELMPLELQLIGFLLKQNFDGIKIDTDHDDQITTLIARRLSSKNHSRDTIKFCFKVLGILANQAITTLSYSQQFFQRLSQQHVLSIIAEHYSSDPDDAIVLEVIEKFVHPRLQRNATLSHKTKALFRTFKQEVAPILLKKGLITAESPTSRKWLKAGDLQIYCGVLWELLNVSQDARNQYSKQTYWKDLLSNKKTKIYFLAMVFSVLQGSGVFDLRNDVIQSEVVPESSDNKLTNVFLLYFAQHLYLKLKPSQNKTNKIKTILEKVKDLLASEQSVKTKSCKQLLGSFNEDSHYFDKILVDILYNLLKECKEQEILTAAKPIIDLALMLPLSEEGLLLTLYLEQSNPQSFNPTEQQIKRLDEYFVQMVKKDGFQDYMTTHPIQCSKILVRLLNIQYIKLQDDKDLAQLAEIIDKHQLLRLFFSEQLMCEELLLVSLKIINRIINRIRSVDFLVHSGLQAIKKYMKSAQQDFKVEMMVFCSHLARTKAQYCHELMQSGIIPICFKSLGEGSEILKEKTLHLIGNLSKHNNQAFDLFQKYNIVNCINKTISQHKSNKRILKNTIYAIGNISYYSERFATEIRPIIKYMLDGLIIDDEHLLLNTVSTISNLLRHGPVHMPPLIQLGVLTRVADIYANTNSVQQVNYINNLLKKAVAYPEFFKAVPKQTLRAAFESHLRKGNCKEQTEVVHKIRKALI